MTGYRDCWTPCSARSFKGVCEPMGMERYNAVHGRRDLVASWHARSGCPVTRRLETRPRVSVQSSERRRG
jgi:hypothetical protein